MANKINSLKNRPRKLTQMEKYLLGIIVIYSIIVSIVNPAFLSLETLFDMLRSASGTMILAFGVLMVIISGGIDVSFTAVAIVGAYSSVKLMLATGIDNLAFAFIISASIGAVLGIINALLIHCFKLPTLIVTLGTSSVFYGFMTTFIGTKSIPLAMMPSSLVKFSEKNLINLTNGNSTYGLSIFVLIVAIVMVITWFILYKTSLGRHIFAIGNSEESAKRSGINILGTRLFIYAFMGVLAGIMGIIYFSQLKMVNPVSLVGTELMIIAAVVIGGTKLSGGEGTIFGALLGVTIIQLFQSTLVFLGLSTSWNDFFIGLILLISVSMISYQTRKKNRENLIFTQ